jgi:uncharacterized protein
MDYFPLALAAGRAFCNRTKEQKILKYNIEEARPTLIISPRRYGKTSLALYTIKKVKVDYAQFDFLSAVDEKDIEKIILKGVGQLLGRLENTPKKILKLATDFFSGLSIKLGLDKVGLTVEINKRSNDSSDNILGILERLEKLSEKQNKKIVLLFDEFQRVYQISKNQAVESVIRQVAQASKRLVFIFSGSSRHLLHKMFNDRDRPFYKLCDKITVNRIDEQDYISYINNAADKENIRISNKEIKQIFNHTARHPYYINLLCSRLWKLKKVILSDVDIAWAEYLNEERSQVANELELLSNSQRKLLITLSRSGGTDAPRSQEFQALAGMPGATIAQALKFLEQKDYVYKDINQIYRVLDPATKAILAEL